MHQATSEFQQRFQAQKVVHHFPSPDRIKVRAGEPIFADGDSAEYFYKLVSGCVRLVKLAANGHRQICDFYLAGDLIGFSNNEEHAFSAETVEECVLLRYRRCEADRLMKADPAFACDLQALTARGLNSAYAHMVRLCHRSARDRLSWFLLDMADRSEKGWIKLPMSRVDIADYLGLAHETVSRMFTQLKKDGVIVERKLNHIRIVNRDALEEELVAA